MLNNEYKIYGNMLIYTGYKLDEKEYILKMNKRHIHKKDKKILDVFFRLYSDFILFNLEGYRYTEEELNKVFNSNIYKAILLKEQYYKNTHYEHENKKITRLNIITCFNYDILYNNIDEDIKYIRQFIKDNILFYEYDPQREQKLIFSTN